jgi:hypothetical protein
VDSLKLKIEGHVLIKDTDSGEVIVNKRNAIHQENMSYALASSLVNSIDTQGLEGFVYALNFGTGGVVIDGVGDTVYREPRVTQITDTLYSPAFSKVVNANPENNIDNNTTVVHEQGTTYSDVVVTCTLDYGEPVEQDPLDNTANQEGVFVFDEIGLMSQQGRLLTHLIFHPVQKSANRKFQVIYTVRISTG